MYVYARAVEGAATTVFMIWQLAGLRAWLLVSPQMCSGCLRCVQAGLTFKNSTFCTHSVFVCSVWILAIIFLYIIN